jgi:predicted nucleotidyltransferase
MLNQHITIPYNEISAFCQRHHIRKLALFGSVLQPDFSADSDIDVLVEFDPEHVPGWEFVGLQEELTQMLGREVDLNTYGSLSRHFRDKVVENAQVIYEPVS